MRAEFRPLVLVIAIAASTGVAAQDTLPGAGRATGSPSPMQGPDNGSLAGPGPITASPLHPGAADAPRGAPPALRSRTIRAARLLGNGTQLDYSQGGANAIGNTGGLTTGPSGSAGAVAGGGGIHAGAVVIPPGTMNGSMRSDDARERSPREPRAPDRSSVAADARP